MYECIMMIISGISMIAGIISAVIAVKAKNEVIKYKIMIEEKTIKKDNFTAVNKGKNNGVIAQNIKGGVNFGKDNK
jgi:hypothetical protein